MKNKLLVQPGDWPKSLVQRVLRAAQPNPDVFAGVTPEQFIRHLLTSLSLDIGDKHRVIKSAPGLSMFQIDALMDVFKDEQKKFARLFDEHPEDIIKVNAQTVVRSFVLANFIDRPFSPSEQIRLTRKMMRRKADAFAALPPDVYERLTSAISSSYLLERVFGVLTELPPETSGAAVYI